MLRSYSAKAALVAAAALAIVSPAKAQRIAGADFQWSYGQSSLTVNDSPLTRAIFGFTVTSPVPGFAMFWFLPSAPAPGVSSAPVCVALYPTPSGGFQATVGYGWNIEAVVVSAATVGFSTGANCNTWTPYGTDVHISIAKE